MRKALIIAMLCVFGFSDAKTQDIHFSEFFITPLFTNPALTGQFDGTYRLTGIVRRQWASVSPQPYQTFGGGAELNKPFNIKPIAIGIRAYHDYTGAGSLTTTSFAIPAALKMRFGASKDFTVSLGFQTEIFQQSLDYSKLTWDDQYFNDRFNPDANTNETRINQSITKLNFSGGLYVEKRWSERKRIGAGISSFNLTQPDKSYFPGGESRLARRNNIHFLSSFKLGSSNIDIMPAGQFQWQGVSDELLLGSAFRYHLSTNPLNKRSIQIGIWGRTRDAAYLSAGFTRNNLFIGGSYDFNLSRLRVASEYWGGWEIGIIYTIATVREKIKRVRQCPDFL